MASGGAAWQAGRHRSSAAPAVCAASRPPLLRRRVVSGTQTDWEQRPPPHRWVVPASDGDGGPRSRAQRQHRAAPARGKQGGNGCSDGTSDAVTAVAVAASDSVTGQGQNHCRIARDNKCDIAPGRFECRAGSSFLMSSHFLSICTGFYGVRPVRYRFDYLSKIVKEPFWGGRCCATERPKWRRTFQTCEGDLDEQAASF